MICPLLFTAQPTSGFRNQMSSVRELAMGADVGRQVSEGVVAALSGWMERWRRSQTLVSYFLRTGQDDGGFGVYPAESVAPTVAMVIIFTRTVIDAVARLF
jgi:hypothetical protein